MRNILAIAILGLLVLSCKKDDEGFSEVPSIEFISITPASVGEFEEEVTLTIKYQDGNGDLGENSPTAKNLFVTDSRNGVEYSYRIQQLAPNDANIIIEGELDVKLKTLSVVGSESSEAVTFNVYVVDRAGNISNTITTSPVTVSK